MPKLPNDLIAGYGSFRGAILSRTTETYATLAEHGQKPKTMIISCCDSRVAPETIFSAGPGELFIYRNVANLVPPRDADVEFHGVSAAVEFAVQALKVENIVVMGHSRCGGVQAALTVDEPDMELSPLSENNFIGQWIEQLGPAKTKMNFEDGADFSTRCQALEEASVRQSLENLMSFPYIADHVKNGKLTLHGTWFDVATGTLMALDQETGVFFDV